MKKKLKQTIAEVVEAVIEENKSLLTKLAGPTILGPDVGYTDLLDHEMVERAKKNEKENKYFPLRPSAAGYCTRQIGRAHV